MDADSVFADTALWVASLDTGAKGVAEVELEMPKNITTWMIRVWSMGPGTRVGQGKAEVVTRGRGECGKGKSEGG